jgi:hypothetical protein
VAAAGAALRTAQLNLGYATVTAPISGRIGRALVTEGALVSQVEATQLALIQQIDPVYVNSTQAVADVDRLRQSASVPGKAAAESAPVRIVLDDGTELPQRGRLLFSDLTVDPTSAQVTLRTEVANPQARLLPGMYVRTRLVQGQITGAMLLPQQAVTRGPQGDTVLVIGEGGKPAPRPVKIGGAAGSQWIVLEGLKPGEQVIAEGFQKMRPGAPVKPVPFDGSMGASAPASAASGARTFRARLGGEPLRTTHHGQVLHRPPHLRVGDRAVPAGGRRGSRSCRSRSTPPWRRRHRRHRGLPGRVGEDAGRQRADVIEQEMNGSPGLIYMESVAQANGSGTLTLTFQPGTNPTWPRSMCRTAWAAPRRACRRP